MCLFGGLNDGFFIKCRFLCAVGDVGRDGVIEEDNMLPDIGDMVSQAGQFDVMGIDTIQKDGARCRIVEARQQVNERRLAAA